MSRGAWFVLGMFVGAFCEQVGQELKAWNERRERSKPGPERYYQAAWDRGYEAGEQAGQAMGRLNEQMGA